MTPIQSLLKPGTCTFTLQTAPWALPWKPSLSLRFSADPAPSKSSCVPKPVAGANLQYLLERGFLLPQLESVQSQLSTTARSEDLGSWVRSKGQLQESLSVYLSQNLALCEG